MRKFSIFGFLFVCLGVLTCASTGFFLSNLLVISNIFQLSSAVEVDGMVVYALSTASCQTKETLFESQTELQTLNGAGYIFKQDETYFLISSIYENLRDAELVSKNLKNNGMNCEIINITLKKESLVGNFSNEEKTVLQNCLNSARTAYKNLYDISISLDTGIYDKQKAKLECNNVFSNYVSTKTNFETLFNIKDFDKINKKLVFENEVLSNLISENTNGFQTFSSLIKYSYCEILLFDI